MFLVVDDDACRRVEIVQTYEKQTSYGNSRIVRGARAQPMMVITITTAMFDADDCRDCAQDCFSFSLMLMKPEKTCMCRYQLGIMQK